jgi:hypothetical protein
MENPTLVVLTDRNDLDDQLFRHLLDVPRPDSPDADPSRKPRAFAANCWPGLRAA